MRQLARWRTLEKGIPIGLLSAALCVPYVWRESPTESLRVLQLWALPFVLVMLAAVTVAWGGDERPWREQLRLAGRFAVPAGIALGLICTVGEDRYTMAYFLDSFPKEPQDVLFALPWVGLFQVLFMVTGAFAFAFRLSRRRTVGLVVVVLLHQGVLILQPHADLPLEVLALGVLFAGLHGLVLGWSYIAVGFAGPVVVAMVCHLRHLIRILLT
ncbi:MAG: hypothetical protein HN849_23190 [Victivallales bacterium]|nr:hypothetical protein [Victivallales bacterium]